MSLLEKFSSFRSKLVACLLVALHEHASTPVQQQQTTLKNLRVEKDLQLHSKGMAAFILGYLISDKTQMPYSDVAMKNRQRKESDEARALNHDLVQAFSEHNTEADLSQVSVIHPTPDDCRRAEKFFLHSLEYDGMQDRETRVATAHEKTFRWVLHEVQPEVVEDSVVERSSLCAWLKSSNQLYWVTGKAGSGNLP